MNEQEVKRLKRRDACYIVEGNKHGCSFCHGFGEIEISGNKYKCPVCRGIGTTVRYEPKLVRLLGCYFNKNASMYFYSVKCIAPHKSYRMNNVLEIFKTEEEAEERCCVLNGGGKK